MNLQKYIIVKKEMTLYLLGDQLQDSNSDMCGFFQLHFYSNLYTPLPDSQILNEDKLNKGTIENYLMRFLHQVKKEINKVEAFGKENEIYRVWYPDSNNNCIYWNCWLRTECHILLKSKI